MVAWLMFAALSVATPAMRWVMAAHALATTEASVSTSPLAKAWMRFSSLATAVDRGCYDVAIAWAGVAAG